MGVSLTKIPKTPAEVAGAVLDAVERDPGSFYMGVWTTLAPGERVRLGDDLCGTAMCAAGWAAFLSGWTVTAEETAEKGDAVFSIKSVGRVALGLSDEEADELFYAKDTEVLARLRGIAGRE
ncbi:hypothetical protein [Streptomyces phytophilus]|uniref:hypothetical protein n=1 Tax=Streptomyces phytophilus TaxID=722715 RepID=UPI0015F1176D|nr:hypothetical protein [Streptomyces phytophilus]